MNNSINYDKITVFYVVMLIWSAYFGFLFIRKRLMTLLYLSIGLFTYVVVSFTFIPAGNGYNLMFFIFCAVVALLFSSKELILADKEGKSAGQFFNLDKLDFAVGILLLLVWLTIKTRLVK